MVPVSINTCDYKSMLLDTMNKHVDFFFINRTSVAYLLKVRGFFVTLHFIYIYIYTQEIYVT